MSVNHNLEEKKNKKSPPFGDYCAEAVIYDHFLCIKNEHLKLYCNSALRRVPSVAAVD